MNKALFFGSVLQAVAAITLLFTGCSKSSNDDLRVAATPVPHAQILESVRSTLKEQGINLVVVITDDFNMPNRALAEKEIDANFFQHLPFLEAQIEAFGYPLVSAASVELEPMGAYSTRFDTIDQLPEGAIIALPNDPTNEARALKLLQTQGLIKIDQRAGEHMTILDLSENSKHFRFIEVDAAMVARALVEVDLAVINTNYALSINLLPAKDALILEGKDSPYANRLVIRQEDLLNLKLLALKKALTSEKTRKFILDTYQGAILPAF